MNRRDRQAVIVRLVQDRALSTQAELVQALRDEGHDVVQTTVSRDVPELGLVKVRAPSGRLIYAAPGTGAAARLRAIQAIDEGSHPSIAGTLAGDNTIFIASKDGTTAQELQAELAAYLADGAV